MGLPRMRPWATATAFAVVTLSLTSRAAAEDGELPVAVLAIQTLDAFEQADALTTALKRVVDEQPGWSTAKTEKEYALQVLVLSLGCNEPPDAACEQKIADEIKVDRFVWGRMQKAGNDVTGDLHFWVRGQGSKEIGFRYSSNLTVAVDEALLGVARQTFVDLTGGPPKAQVTVKAGSVDGDVVVDGKPFGKIKGGVAVLDLEPGAHSIEMRADGYSPISTQVDLKPREKKEVTLVPIEEPAEGLPYQKILGATAIGLGAAAAGVATFAGVRVMQIEGDLEPYTTDGVTIPKGKDGCDPGPNGDYPNRQGPEANKVRELCDSAKPFETMQLALWPVAGALAGTGIILLATADWSSSEREAAFRSPVWIEPRFGPVGGDVTVIVRY